MPAQIPNPTNPTTTTDIQNEKYEFNTGFQRRILAMLFHDHAGLASQARIVKAEYFDNQVFQDIARIIIEFFKQYARSPLKDEFAQKIGELLISKPFLPENDYFAEFEKITAMGKDGGFEFSKDAVVKFAKYQTLKNALLSSSDKLRTASDYGGIKALMDEALTFCPESNGLEVVPLADRERKETEWFWWNKIPKAKLSLIVGDPGVGKSYFTMWLAASVTSGGKLPGSGHRLECGEVVIISAEDGIDDTIVPRIEDNGGDKERAYVIRGTKEGRLFSLVSDLPRLEDFIKSKGRLRLIIIDPISAYFGVGGKTNTYKDTDVRAVLDPLATLAEKHRVTIIGIMHLNKSQLLDAVHRVSGSMAFVAVARSVWAITREKREGEDSSLRYFTPVKTNLSSKDEPGLVWSIDGGSVVFPRPEALPPRLEEQFGSHTPRKKTKIDLAKDLLARVLKEGPAGQEELIKMAADEGISKSTLDRAKTELKVKSMKAGGSGEPWQWELPESQRYSTDDVLSILKNRVKSATGEN